MSSSWSCRDGFVESILGACGCTACHLSAVPFARTEYRVSASFTSYMLYASGSIHSDVCHPHRGS
eukprot:scaffold170333_cov50-Tisochrysis_lutea.AAC.1